MEKVKSDGWIGYNAAVECITEVMFCRGGLSASLRESRPGSVRIVVWPQQMVRDSERMEKKAERINTESRL